MLENPPFSFKLEIHRLIHGGFSSLEEVSFQGGDIINPYKWPKINGKLRAISVAGDGAHFVGWWCWRVVVMVFSFYFPRVVEVLWWRLEADFWWNFPDQTRELRNPSWHCHFVPIDSGKKHQIVCLCCFLWRILVDVWLFTRANHY